MNCFQKLLSSWWRTACKPLITWPLALWIAFKNYYLRDEGQPRKNISQCTIVVNCFQKLLSSWWRTARKEALAVDLVLWIAFKNYYLRDEGQHNTCFVGYSCCCELLSKIIIFVMKDSLMRKLLNGKNVVNCFQKLLSSWWRTAFHNKYNNFP